ncbi:hypothetical protein AU467_22565 [Mesorhizobium loti]|uniref:Uncharacterized protein n=1 Tax=Rhizobium loti TaxID=381 RepID=A0A101KT45_RHILI|nr:hypothetical protein AU467_22565 [Mesorhizobium loti]
MVANAGIVLSGVLVMLLNSPLPDLVVGVMVVGIVLKGGWEILAKRAKPAILPMVHRKETDSDQASFVAPSPSAWPLEAGDRRRM